MVKGVSRPQNTQDVAQLLLAAIHQIYSARDWKQTKNVHFGEERSMAKFQGRVNTEEQLGLWKIIVPSRRDLELHTGQQGRSPEICNPPMKDSNLWKCKLI